MGRRSRPTQRLQSTWSSAPFSWVDIGYRLREAPVVSREVFSIVLPLAVWVIGWLAKNMYSASASMLIVSVDIFDADHDGRFQGDVASDLNQDHGTIADVQLSSMISHADAQGEPERLT